MTEGNPHGPHACADLRLPEQRGLARSRERIHSIVLVTVERALAVTSPAYDLGGTEDELRTIHRDRLLS